MQTLRKEREEEKSVIFQNSNKIIICASCQGPSQQASCINILSQIHLLVKTFFFGGGNKILVWNATLLSPFSSTSTHFIERYHKFILFVYIKNCSKTYFHLLSYIQPSTEFPSCIEDSCTSYQLSEHGIKRVNSNIC